MNLTENDLTLYSKFKISSADTDMFLRIRPGGVVNLLIQSAISSAEILGFGVKGLRKEQLYWVLSRMTLEIYQPMTWNQDIEVETWPKKLEGLLYIRDYIIRDKAQNIIVRATSGWLAIDAEAKKPKTLDAVQAEMFVHLKEKHALQESPVKLGATQAGDEFDVKSTYFDIDLNRHVTSTRYFDWMMDTFTIDFHKNHYPKKISINFMKETLPGDTINIKRGSEDDLQFCFEGINSARKTVAFRGKIDF